MKLFRKAMAVMLAGVLALTVLTGCSSSINHMEIVAVMNDILKMELGGRANVTLTETSSQQADKLITLLKNGYTADKENFDAEYFFKGYDYSSEKPGNENSEKAWSALGITKDTKDGYAVMVTKITQYQGTYNKAHSTYEMLMNGMENLVFLNSLDDIPSNNGTLSMNTVTFDDVEYLVMVMKLTA